MRRTLDVLAAAIPLTATTTPHPPHTTHTNTHTTGVLAVPIGAKEAQTKLCCGPPTATAKWGLVFLVASTMVFPVFAHHEQHGHAALPACPARRAHSSRLKLTEVDFPDASTTRVPCGLGESNCVLPTRSVLSALRLVLIASSTSELLPHTALSLVALTRFICFGRPGHDPSSH